MCTRERMEGTSRALRHTGRRCSSQEAEELFSGENESFESPMRALRMGLRSLVQYRSSDFLHQ